MNAPPRLEDKQNGIKYDTNRNTIGFYDDDFQKEFELRYGVTGIILARMGTEKKLHVLMNVRSNKISGGGETCLPGGGVDKIDRIKRATIARELMEELKIEHWRLIEIDKARLEPCISGTGFLTHTFALLTTEDDLKLEIKSEGDDIDKIFKKGLRLSEYEIEDAFFMPLDFIFNPPSGCFKDDAVRKPGNKRVGGNRKFTVEQYYYRGPNINGEVKDYVISGPTTRALRQLKEQFQTIERFEEMLAPYEARLAAIEDPRPLARIRSLGAKPDGLSKT